MYRKIFSCYFKVFFVMKGIFRQGYFRVEKKNQDKGEENFYKIVKVKRIRKNLEKRIQDKSENSVRLSGRKKVGEKIRKYLGKNGGKGKKQLREKLGKLKIGKKL